MKEIKYIMVVNAGSSSVKTKIFDYSTGGVIASGSLDDIKSAQPKCRVEVGGEDEKFTVDQSDIQSLF